MKRSIILAIVLGVGALSLAIVEAQDAMVIEVEQLEDNLYVLRGQGGGGNTAVFVTSNGVVVVDSKNPGWGQSILDAIAELTSNPVTTLVNTHSHHDHVSGNVAFPANVDIVTHEVTAANMQVMRAYSGRTEPPANVFADSMGRGLPTQTFSERMSIGTGDDRVDLYHFGRGHTAATPGSSSRCTGRCIPATSSRARTCPSSTPTTAAAASTFRTACRRRTTTSRASTRSSPGTAPR